MHNTVTIIDFKKSLEQYSRLIGIDYGSKKIGLSLSDREKIIASPYKTLIRKNLKFDIKYICDIIDENAVSGIVFGYPIEAKGYIGETCAAVDKFCKELIAKRPLPYYFQDERLSTSAVRQILRHTNMSPSKKNNVDDKMAACYVLQIVLDIMNTNN
jgi:putative Holliday junction resolvase